MYTLSQRSLTAMRGIDTRLQKVIKEALSVSPVDFGIPHSGGMRTAEEQHIHYINGASKCDGYVKQSKHQKGEAFDVIAYVNGLHSFDEHYYYIIAGVILSTAARNGIKLRWGGDWDGDGTALTDQNFNDIGHFEIN